MRDQLDAYTKDKYGIEPEMLPFSHENYEIYRHTESGKWFAVFIVKDRKVFGLDGDDLAEVLCVKLRDRLLSDYLAQQPGYLQGFPSPKWNWTSMVLDGTVPFEDICHWLDESYQATKTKTKNLRVPLPKRE